MNILWLITARSGSQGIPDKNIRCIENVPLIVWKAMVAKGIGGTVWVSTDSEKYADIARSHGVEVPFIRPEHLATSTASSVDVCLHAMEYASAQGLSFDALGLLEPTSPFVRKSSILAAVDKLEKTPQAEAIVAVRESHPNTLFIQPEGMYLEQVASNIASLANVARQAFKTEVTPSGGFYITRWNSFLESKTFYTSQTLQHMVDPYEGIEIDRKQDLLWCEFLVQQQITSLQSVLNS